MESIYAVESVKQFPWLNVFDYSPVQTTRVKSHSYSIYA